MGVWTTLSVFLDAGGRFAKRHTEMERRKETTRPRERKKKSWRMEK
jgi:hypothetical protein